MTIISDIKITEIASNCLCDHDLVRTASRPMHGFAIKIVKIREN